MSEKRLQDRLNDFEDLMKSVKILTKQGTANEMQFYIFDYDPKDELKVRDQIAKVKRINSEIVEFDLYDMIIEIVKNEGYFESIIKIEKEYPKEVMLNQMIDPLLALEENENAVMDIFKKRALDNGKSIVLITGVGKAYPIIRSHTILNNLHSVFNKNPVVMMYPGRYETESRSNMSLNLFEKLGDDNYYRAFPLVGRGDK